MSKKQTKKSSHSRKLVVFAGLTVVVSLLFVISFSAYSNRLITIGKEKGEEASSVLGTATSLASNGVIELRVGTLEQAATIPKVYEVDKGSRAVCVAVDVHNISGSEKLFIPLEEIKLVDEDGTRYDIAGVLTCAPGVGGPVQVGEVISGKLGFLLPDTAKKYKLHYIPLDKNTKSFIISDI